MGPPQLPCLCTRILLKVRTPMAFPGSDATQFTRNRHACMQATIDWALRCACERQRPVLALAITFLVRVTSTRNESPQCSTHTTSLGPQVLRRRCPRPPTPSVGGLLPPLLLHGVSVMRVPDPWSRGFPAQSPRALTRPRITHVSHLPVVMGCATRAMADQDRLRKATTSRESHL
jgi:hypothetical protein